MTSARPGPKGEVDGPKKPPKAVLLTATVTWAADQWFELHVLEMPDLIVHSRSLSEAPNAVKTAAARSTNREPEYFSVRLLF
ncbi:hypothetical protein ACFRJ9_14525 [Paenarthrobacter sp. NPDC056912]|uniref:hypothetical protein n=1 Tax=Paenarthrobacter sp. NPDC056912 TaxID=3345965 RepID=UPI0036729C41